MPWDLENQQIRRYTPGRQVAYRRGTYGLSALGHATIPPASLAGLYKAGRFAYTHAPGPSEIAEYFKSSKGKRKATDEGRPKKEQRKKQKKEEYKKETKKDMGNNKGSGGGGGVPAGGRRNPRFNAPKKSYKKGAYKTRHDKSVSAKQIKKWNKAASNALIDISYYHHYERKAKVVSCVANSSAFDTTTGLNMSSLEGKLSAVPMVDTSVSPPVKADTDLTPTSSTNFSQQFDIKYGTHAQWSNNYAVPVWIDAYCLVPKEDTIHSPVTAFANGLVDQGNVSATSVHVFPSHSATFNQFWKINDHKRVCLAPGESVHLGYKKGFKFDPSHIDFDSSDYQAKYGSHTYATRIQGCFGHSLTTPANTGSSIASVDLVVDEHLKLKYEGGIKMTNYTMVDVALAQTGGTVIGWPGNAANTVYTQ